jgi:hypothetical protein
LSYAYRCDNRENRFAGFVFGYPEPAFRQQGQQQMMRIDSGWVHQSRFFLIVVIALIAGAIRVDAQTGCAGVANDPEGSSTWIPKFCQEFNDPMSRAPAVWTYDLDGGGCGNHEVEI